jgi:putative hydrolase of the HAD superfamily
MDKEERRKLASIIRDTSVPLFPQPPCLPAGMPHSRHIPAIKAVLFDVYGTLFTSAAGDIGVAANAASASELPLESLAGQYGLCGARMRSFFIEEVKKAHLSLASKTPWPEVRVDEIWDKFLKNFTQRHEGAPKDARELALRYELAVNPVYPMPGALETMSALKEAGFILGIISNAQFFTPLLFDAFFSKTAEELGFDPEVLFWSFEHGEAKPSPRLYEAAVKKLEAKGIKACECVFVGNDMLSDIYGAVNAGFSGVLFAGDSRSLRLREEDQRVKNIKPSWIISSLSELVLKITLR